MRDHWPWDYWATGLHGNRVPYPTNTVASLLTDLPARLNPLTGVLAAPAVPYMLHHLHSRAAWLARADAVVAVSHYIARRLTAVVPSERVTVIPNLVDLAAIAATVATPLPDLPPAPYVLFVGKLEHNKGAHLLPAILRDQPAAPHLVVAGDGPLRAQLDHDCAAAGVTLHLLPGWTDHDTVLRLMARADIVLLPSTWGEPLSRVWLEACAAGACIVATRTGGIDDAIQSGRDGLVASSVPGCAAAVRRLLADPALRNRLRHGARERARTDFAAPVVMARVEALYRSLVAVRSG
ncbi:MAG: hypothetical protein NVS2B7_39520 [Herpetosiphon sp.]